MRLKRVSTPMCLLTSITVALVTSSGASPVEMRTRMSSKGDVDALRLTSGTATHLLARRPKMTSNLKMAKSQNWLASSKASWVVFVPAPIRTRKRLFKQISQQRKIPKLQCRGGLLLVAPSKSMPPDLCLMQSCSMPMVKDVHTRFEAACVW